MDSLELQSGCFLLITALHTERVLQQDMDRCASSYSRGVSSVIMFCERVGRVEIAARFDGETFTNTALI